MKAFFIAAAIACLLAALCATPLAFIPAPPAKTETLTCVRVKQVTPAGTINYLCEVRK